MIKTRTELKKTLMYERKLYPNSLFDYITRNQRVFNWKFIILLRKTEYYHTNKDKSIFNKIMYVYYRLRKNLLGVKIGVEIDSDTFAEGLLIHHNGNIVVNNNATVGSNCQLHGDNCIGNNGVNGGSKCPIIGDNVDVGVGAKIIGDVYIANNIKIGANAVVTKSFFEEGITIAGVPARKIK